MSAPPCLGPEPQPATPARRLPPGSIDAHCHVFDDPVRYPLVEPRTYTPAPAPLAAYLRMAAAIGVARTVQVNASVYGIDNRITLAAIAALGPARARGVAGVAPDVSNAELERLQAGGMRGVRLSTHVAGYGGTALIEALAVRLAPFGWHVQLHVARASELAALEDRLLRVRVPLVFDHLGCVHGAEGVGSDGFQALLRVLRARDDAWVKLSSWYRRSQVGPPGYADIRPLVEALVDARPDRVVFGTNWPHPNLFPPDAVPRDADLVDRLCEWVPDEAVRVRLCVQNPERLYGFEPFDAAIAERNPS